MCGSVIFIGVVCGGGVVIDGLIVGVVVISVRDDVLVNRGVVVGLTRVGGVFLLICCVVGYGMLCEYLM